MLEARQLECTRGDRVLFSDLAFRVSAGELLHVIGPNGAGKTTLLRTICGLTRPSAGAVCWEARTISSLGDEYRSQLAFVGHSNGVQPELSAEENLRIAACTHARVREADIERALAKLGLSAYARFPAKILSQGQRRRLALARLLVTNKRIWVLDEPLSALDKDSVANFNDLLAAQTRSGGLVVLTSHQEVSVAGGRTLNLGRAA